MQTMLSEDEMAMILMATSFGSNLPMVAVVHHHRVIATAAITVVAVDVLGFLGVQTIELLSLDYLHRLHGRI